MGELEVGHSSMGYGSTAAGALAVPGSAPALGHDLCHLAAPYRLMHGPEHAGYLLLQPHFHLGASLLSLLS